MNTPTLLNLPPPPSDTPSDMGPGTPNSTTTSLSALSTVAFKDGHQGHNLPSHHHHHHQHHHSSNRDSTSSTTTLDAERADRISRLAGLERVNRPGASSFSGLMPSAHNRPAGGPSGGGYFDSMLPAAGAGIAPHMKERSTVGSASATGSVGGGRTWASGSVGATTADEDIDDTDVDKMSEDPDAEMMEDVERGSSDGGGGLSDEGNASLVGFGEGAGSTVSGPISTGAGLSAAGIRARQAQMQQAGLAQQQQQQQGAGWGGGSGDAVMGDAATPPVVGQTGMRGFNGSGQGTEMAERILRERLPGDDGARRLLGTPEGATLGRFGFERE